MDDGLCVLLPASQCPTGRVPGVAQQRSDSLTEPARCAGTVSYGGPHRIHPGDGGPIERGPFNSANTVLPGLVPGVAGPCLVQLCSGHLVRGCPLVGDPVVAAAGLVVLIEQNASGPPILLLEPGRFRTLTSGPLS
jgi:hypothetical protein